MASHERDPALTDVLSKILHRMQELRTAFPHLRLAMLIQRLHHRQLVRRHTQQWQWRFIVFRWCETKRLLRLCVNAFR